jgi:FkbM family methyltransferase
LRNRSDAALTADDVEQGAGIGPLRPVGGARFADMALIAYGRAFEHPAKIRLVRWLIRRMAAGRIHVRQAGGAVLAVDPQDYIGWTVFKTGFYEPASLALAMRLMAAEPGLFVDVGAHLGWYTCAVASIAGCKVISIEPDCGNCAALRDNLAINRFDNVTVFNGAAASHASLLSLAMRSRGNAGTVAVDAEHSSAQDLSAKDLRADAAMAEDSIGQDLASGTRRYWVAATTLDALLAKLVLPPTRPVLL